MNSFSLTDIFYRDSVQLWLTPFYENWWFSLNFQKLPAYLVPKAQTLWAATLLWCHFLSCSRQALCYYDNKGYKGRLLSPSSDTSESFPVACGEKFTMQHKSPCFIDRSVSVSVSAFGETSFELYGTVGMNSVYPNVQACPPWPKSASLLPSPAQCHIYSHVATMAAGLSASELWGP